MRSLRDAVLTVEEVRAILAAPCRETVLGLRDWALLETLYGTGIRRNECFELNLDHIDLGNRTLTVLHGKGGKGRVVPIGPRLAGALHAYLDRARPTLCSRRGEKAFFLSRDGERFAYTQIGRVVLQAARQAGLKRTVGPHDLRHAAATHLLAAGADVRKVQAILGHESADTTAAYTHVAQDEAARSFRDHHPRARRKPREQA